MRPGKMSAEEARRRADQQFGRAKPKESDLVAEKKRIQVANAEKTARLRAMRLAKEAADREAAAKHAAENPAQPKKKRAKKAAPAASAE